LTSIVAGMVAGHVVSTGKSIKKLSFLIWMWFL
jgi:hypothetical protein